MSEKPTLENTPQIDNKAKIIAYVAGENGIAIHVENAKFRGSLPIIGYFQVQDEDNSIWQGEDRKYYADVFCSWHGTDRDDELLTLELDDYPDEVIIGWDDEVIAAIG